MTYHQFVETVEENVKKEVGETCTVCTQSTRKNNGISRFGLLITEQGVNISPTIYLEEFYQQYEDGRTMREIVEDVLRLYEEVRFRESWSEDELMNFSRVKEKIVYRLINFDKNREMLKCTPYEKYHDLAVIYCVLVNLNVDGSSREATMTIRDTHLKYWGVSKDDVKSVALKNTERLFPWEFCGLGEVLQHCFEMEPPGIQGEESMYVLTNRTKNYGASVILYRGLLQEIGKRFCSDFFILPSSIHEGATRWLCK